MRFAYSVGCLIAVALLPAPGISTAAFSPDNGRPNRHGGPSATSIPFELWDGQVVVDTRWNGTPQKAIIDTGCGGILWPAHLKFSGRQTAVSKIVTMEGGLAYRLQGVVIDRIQVGACQLRNVSTYAVGAQTDRKPAARATLLPLLGNSAFMHKVLTIDYAKQRVTIGDRPTTDKVMAGPPRTSVRFTWADRNKDNFPGVPVVNGRLNGRRARILLDTGWAGAYIAISSTYEREGAHRVKLKRGMLVTRGRLIDVKVWSRVNLHIQNLKKRCAAMVMPLGSQGQDCIIGTDFLKPYRVTFDFPNRTITLVKAR